MGSDVVLSSHAGTNTDSCVLMFVAQRSTVSASFGAAVGAMIAGVVIVEPAATSADREAAS